jgi:oligopeptide/dipeptide ABC transporter ATP-binding protein
VTLIPTAMPVDSETVPTNEILRVERMSVRSRRHRLVHEISFTLQRGDRVGLIGESGSGKSLTALALLGLLPEGVGASGSAIFGDSKLEIIGAGERQLAQVRGREIAMVFQEPMTALNPTKPVGKQVAEALRIHRTVADRKSAHAEAVRLLDQVRLSDPAQAARAYPHQLSGGQRQRVVLAMAMANRPSLLLCDEPTTALDVTVQALMLELIAGAALENDSSLLFITHDLAVVSTICERVIVMYGGRVVESGDIEDVFRRPRHPYTQGLLAASYLSAVDGHGKLSTIPGSVPAAGQFPEGCVFRNRCQWADDACLSLPRLTAHEAGSVACWHPLMGSRT